MSIRTRFAPSPTGFLHIGGVRTALFNWLYAKQSGGQFVLRIDDTDANRNVSEALQPILDGFNWLGITWDEGPNADGTESVGDCGPYFQSQRTEKYQAAAKQLLESGKAYRDYARPEELQEQRQAAEKSGVTFVYDRQWMAETDEQAAAFEAEGRTAVVRLKMPREGVCKFNDEVRGDVEFEWSVEQDHVIQRADGSCLYHLASVVDDHEMKISHVIRAVEHLSNTPRQIFILEALGYERPTYAHLPFVAEPGGTAKLSKRKLDKYLKNKEFASLCELGNNIAEKIGISKQEDFQLETFNPVIVDFYRDIGFRPESLLNYLLLLGWSLDDSTEDFTVDQMLEHFTLTRVNKAPASFDPAKLLAFQTRWMQRWDAKPRTEACLQFLQKAQLVSDTPDNTTLSKVNAIVAAADDRIKVAGDILNFDDFFAADDQLKYDEKAFEKRLVNDEPAVELLKEFSGELEQLAEFTVESTEACLKGFVESKEIKFNQIIHALRMSTTGKPAGFGMFDTLAILGKQSCLGRIQATLDTLASQATS
ncbi:MAG: glutamate--tRNA ligase [Aureliella sp.]